MNVAEAAPRPARGRRILVVEDSPSAQRLLHELLVRLGVAPSELQVAATVPEALLQFARWEPDLAMVDLELRAPSEGSEIAPGDGDEGPLPTDGAELALRMLRRNPGLKVIICSASEPQGTILDPLLHEGRVLFLVKPLRAERVAEALDRVARELRYPAG